LIQINNKVLTLALIASAICLHYACSPSIDKLEVLNISNIRVDSITPELITLRAEVAIKNPYYSSATLKNISFDVSFTGNPVAYGKLAGSTQMKARATAILDVPLAISCKNILRKDFDAFLQDQVPYRIDGNAVLERPFGPRTLPIHVSNVLPKQQKLRLQLNQRSALDVLSPDVSGTAELSSLIRNKQLSMRFYNPLRFNISADPFRYEIRLGSAIVANGRSVEPLNLLPGNNRFRVTVDPHPMALAGNVLDLLITRTIPDLTLESNFNILTEQNSLKVQLIYSPSK